MIMEYSPIAAQRPTFCNNNTTLFTQKGPTNRKIKNQNYKKENYFFIYWGFKIQKIKSCLDCPVTLDINKQSQPTPHLI